MSKKEYISWGDMSEKEKADFLSQIHLKLRNMSRAEKFCQDYTRNCSNEIEWNVEGLTSHDYVPWLTPDQARKAVEIAKEEMFEKVCEFLDNDLCCYIKAQDFAIEHQRLKNDLKQAMKDE